MSCEVTGNDLVKSNMKKANDETNVQNVPDRVDDNRRTRYLTEQKTRKLNKLNKMPNKLIMGKTTLAVSVFHLSKPSESKSSFRLTFVI